MASKKAKKTRGEKISKAVKAARSLQSRQGNLAMMDAWRSALVRNQKVKKSDRATDAELVEWMNRQFPDRPNEFTVVPRRYHTLDSGDFEFVDLPAYDDNGEPCSSRSSKQFGVRDPIMKQLDRNAVEYANVNADPKKQASSKKKVSKKKVSKKKVSKKKASSKKKVSKKKRSRVKV